MPPRKKKQSLGPTQVPSVSQRRRDIQKASTRRRRKPRSRGPVYPVRVYKVGEEPGNLNETIMGDRALSEWTGSYGAYLRSDHWQETKRRLRKQRQTKTCEICACKRWLVVHHISYVRVGREAFADLLLVCKKCHDELHRRVKNTGNAKELANAHNLMIAERKNG